MSKTKSVCIIDDDKVYTFGVKKIIKSHLPENDVITYENGKKALEGIKEMIDSGSELPDLILLDIDMPEMNGWDFLKEFDKIRSTVEKNIEIFVISSRVNTNTEDLYKIEWDEKVSDFIKKPVQVEALKKLLS
ncbi:MAG TPA: response regulator [Balneola sp.]|jgi:response regulator RpfG family c-di-GMP phosphodiesterase|nr:response regulator [Bacteroidota bacterium]MAC05480.1 response regulator [Balneola sp.]MAB66538.1 response regulator [Bacteroidota bacterium]MAO77498.1 response regulator [Balneola sp.]MBF66007.1 response regulator [Balneola sp.]|tara:strand:+ start:5442 stop:5840 length:399 start_codon:yes stop_codon:yes gene_type:complete